MSELVGSAGGGGDGGDGDDGGGDDDSWGSDSVVKAPTALHALWVSEPIALTFQ